MHFTHLTVLSFLAAAVTATPLNARTDSKNNWGTCPSRSQYTCASSGKINALNCVSILSGNTIEVPIGIRLRVRHETAPAPTEEGAKYCCKTKGGLIAALGCVNLLSGNEISAPLDVIVGLL